MNHRIRRHNLKIATALLGCGFISTAAAAQEADAGNAAMTLTYASIAIALFLTIILHFAALPVARRISRNRARRRLRRILSGASIDMLDDFILPGAYEGLTRIDFAALTSAGVLCVRTLHCDGAVSGAACDPQWLHIDGARQRRFLNPVIQNDGHVKAMKNIAGDLPVQNLVIFSGSASFFATHDSNVVHIDALGAYLENFASSADCDDNFEEGWQKIRRHAMTDAATRKDLEAQLSFG